MLDVRLRPMTIADRERVFAWRNHPDIVERSSSRRSVSVDEHDAWFGRILTLSQSIPYIVEADGQPIGQVRFDREGESLCLITAYLDPPSTGRGLGVTAIRIGCLEVQQRWPGIRIVAFVREDNAMGLTAFRKAGFRDGNLTCPPYHFAVVFESLANESQPLFSGLSR